MIVRDIMTTDVISVTPSTDLHTLAKMFVDKGFSGAPVVDDEGAYRGVVFEEGLIIKDKKVHLPTFLNVLFGYVTIGEQQFEDEMKKIAAITVDGIMEARAMTLTPETPIEDVATMMVDEHIHYFPVLDNGALVGVVTKKDIVRAIAQHKI